MREILFRLKGQTGFERRQIEWYYSKETSDEDSMSQNISRTCEVIGNIYDNPELLEENKKMKTKKNFYTHKRSEMCPSYRCNFA